MPGFQALLIYQSNKLREEGLSLLTITNSTVTREHVWAAFRRTRDVRWRERYHAILRLMDGQSCPEVAPWLYRDEETIRAWGHALHEAGLRGWERAPIPGRPTWLTAAQRTQINDAVRRCPRESGSHRSVWTPKLGRHFIYTHFGLAYCRERIRQLRHALGFRLRRLRHRHRRAKPAEQEACRAELEARLGDWPEEWELLFVDAATGRRHPTLTAQWGLVDEGPEVPTGDDHAKVHVYGAVAPLTGRTHYHISPASGTQEFAQFLRHLRVYHPGKRLLVIHDRGEPHTGVPGEALVREAKGRLMLKAQPAYSPELHPPERLGKWRRRVVPHHHWCATLGEQIGALRTFFRSRAGVKDQVRRLCGVKAPDSLIASL